MSDEVVQNPDGVQQTEQETPPKAAKKVKQVVRSEEHPDCVLMTKDGEPDAVVNDNSIEAMEEQGWKVKTKKAADA